MDWSQYVVTAVVGLFGGGGLVALLRLRSDKKQLTAGTDKLKMEAADILADSAVALLMPLKEELNRVSAKADQLAAKVAVLEDTLTRERATSEVRIKQLEADIAERDRHIKVQSAEIIELRSRIKSAPGWPGAN